VIVAAVVALAGFRSLSTGLLVAFAAFTLLTSALELRWRLFGRRTPQARAAMAFPPAIPASQARRSFSLIVPALDEPYVLGETLATLARQTHPQVQIVVSLVAGDEPTIGQAKLAATQSSRINVVICDYAAPAACSTRSSRASYRSAATRSSSGASC
jgi:cellulose synthase/poly-beta-1,6-N-acetylglucosamine synthase-like glycosyltransferase